MSGNGAMSVLYDAPGPRARRWTVVASIVVLALVALGVYYLIYLPLDHKQQFSMKYWGPLIDPGNEYFTQVWKRIGEGFRATLIAAGLAIISSLVVGTALAVLRVQLKSQLRRRYTGLAAPVALVLRGLTLLINALTRFCVEVFRGIPVVITIFFVSVGLPEFGLTFQDALWYLVIGLTIYNSVVIGEILRSGMEGLPSGQQEAAEAIGLTPFQTIRMILLPQAFRIMLPSLISQLVVVLKDTSLGFIISYEEALRVGSQIMQFLGNLIQVYAVIGIIYILVNYALSKLAQYVERRLRRASRGSGAAADVPQPVVTGASEGDDLIRLT